MYSARQDIPPGILESKAQARAATASSSHQSQRPRGLANCQRRKEQQGSVLPQDNSKLGQGRVGKFQALGRSAGDFTLSGQGSGLISFEGKKQKEKKKNIHFQTFRLQKQTPQCTGTPSGPFCSPPLSKTIELSQT